MHNAAGAPRPISPRASGRSRLCGCRRSASRSAMSFRMYTALETRQKAANKTSTSATSLGSLHPWPKTTPMKRNPFLIHWWGRIRRMRALVIGSVLYRAGRRAQIALAEIAVSLRQVPGNGVVTLLQRLQYLLAIRGEIESTAQHDMKGRTRKCELLVFNGAEVGPILRVFGRGLAQHEDIPAVQPPEIGQDVVVPRVRGCGAEYGHMPARMKGRDCRHRVSVGGEIEFHLVGFQLPEDFRHADVIHDSVVETGALPGVERQHRRGHDRGDVEGAQCREVEYRAPQLLARQQPASRDEKERHEGEHPMQADKLDRGERGEEPEGERQDDDEKSRRRLVERGRHAPAPSCEVPQGDRAEQVEHRDDVDERRLPGPAGGVVPVVEIEHQVRPAMLVIPPQVDGGERKRTQHDERKRAPVALPARGKRDMNYVGQSQYDREILRKKRQPEKYAGERVPAGRAPADPHPEGERRREAK